MTENKNPKKTVVVTAETKEKFDVGRMGYIVENRKMIGNDEFLNILLEAYEASD